jgi:hypothetical protein
MVKKQAATAARSPRWKRWNEAEAATVIEAWRQSGELKRRRVLRVAGVYAVAGWIVVQVAATTFPRRDSARQVSLFTADHAGGSGIRRCAR